MQKKLIGLNVVAFLASIAGIIVSFLLLREDVISTAKTVFEFFPSKYGVVPSASWEGAIILGIFTSVLQVVSASVWWSSRFPLSWRWLAFFSFSLSCAFDNWTDVVFRSGYLTGNTMIATISTMAFYTLGSEVTQSLSWLVFASMWRNAISDIMWGAARFGSGISSIGAEWKKFTEAARRKENKDRELEEEHPKKRQPEIQPVQTQAQRPPRSDYNGQATYPPVNLPRPEASHWQQPITEMPEFLQKQIREGKRKAS